MTEIERDTFENKLFNYEELLFKALQKLNPGAQRGSMFTARNNRQGLLQLEQTVLDMMGDDGWFPSGGRNIQGEYYYSFSRLKVEE